MQEALTALREELVELERETDELAEVWLDRRVAGHSNQQIDLAFEQVRRAVNRVNRKIRDAQKRDNLASAA